MSDLAPTGDAESSRAVPQEHKENGGPTGASTGASTPVLVLAVLAFLPVGGSPFLCPVGPQEANETEARVQARAGKSTAKVGPQAADKTIAERQAPLAAAKTANEAPTVANKSTARVDPSTADEALAGEQARADQPTTRVKPQAASDS